MIPIGDVNPRRTFPVATVALIALNLGVFLYQISLPTEALNRLYLEAGAVPVRLTRALDARVAGTLLTSMFVHGSWGHLLSNMVFLWIFGDNIEDRLGILTFLALYLATGVLATLAQVAVYPTSRLPIVGASGALAGVAGTYLVLFPRARVRVVVPLFFFLRILEISALVFFIFWFAMQAAQGLATITLVEQGSVAWFAHFGGFLAGLGAGFVLRGGARLVAEPGGDPLERLRRMARAPRAGHRRERW